VAVGWAGRAKARAPECTDPRIPGRKLSIGLQILDCELHKNAFGGLAPPGHDGGGGYSVSPGPLAVIRSRGRREWEGKGLEYGGVKGGREGHEGVRSGIGKGGMGRRRTGKERGSGRGEKIGKGEGGLDLILV